MAKNNIQFQPGMSLQELLAQYGTEEQCYQALFQWRWPHGIQCPRCGNTHFYSLKTRKLFQCGRCGHQVSLIAGTIFDSTKLPLKTWFLGMYFIAQCKTGLSALSLKRLIGVSSNTALLMKHKIQQVMKERDDSKPIACSMIQLDDAYWGGKKHDGIRGRGATDKLPFVAAVSTNDKGHPIAMCMSQVASFSKQSLADWASIHLSNGCKIVSDGLQCFNAFDASGFEHQVIVTGGGPESVKLAEFKWVNTMIGNVKTALHGTFHAISQKHFPRYLAEFCYRFNRRFELQKLLPRFCYVALRTRPFPQRILSNMSFVGN